MSNHECPQPCNQDSGGPCAACTNLALLDVQILDVKKALGSLLKLRRELLVTEVNPSHDPLIRKLPVEIVSNIFELVVEDPKKHPTFLGSICQAWRRIAWSTQKLWSTIDIEIRDAQDSFAKIHFLEQYISRSGILPLSITFCSNVHDLPNYDSFIGIINQCSDRWNSLCIKLPCPFLERFHGRTEQPFGAPYLESLVLQDSECREGWKTASFSLGNVKPSPIRLELNIPPENVDIDWTRLTFVSATKIRVDQAFRILLQASNLRQCVLDIAKRSHGMHDTRSPPFSDWVSPLHCLDLCLSSEIDDELQFFFENLVLPSLEELSITRFSNDIRRFIDPFISFLARYSCSLTKLSLDILDLTVRDLIPILSVLPLLSKLAIDTSTGRRAKLDLLFKRLTAGPASGGHQDVPTTFLPALMALQVKGSLNSWNPVLALCFPERFFRGTRRSLSVIKVDRIEESNENTDDLPQDIAWYILQRREQGISIQLNSFR